jgi:hypothetical protein
VEVLVDGFHAEDFSRPARKSAAGAAEARKSRRMVFVSSDEDEDDNHDAEQQEEVWKPIRLEHLRKAGVPGPRKRKVGEGAVVHRHRLLPHCSAVSILCEHLVHD